VLNFTNSNGGSSTSSASLLNITAMTDSSATTVNLSGAVQLGGVSGTITATNTGAIGLIDAATSAIKVTGSTDHANVVLNMLGAGAKTITLGNGNDSVITNGGVDTITLGTGTSKVIAGGGADSVTFGAHTSGAVYVIDTEVQLNRANATDTGVFTAPTTNGVIDASAFDIVSGFQLGDSIQFAGLYSGANTFGTAYDPTNVGNAANAGYTDIAANTTTDGSMSSTAILATTLVSLGTANSVTFARGTYTAATKQFIQSSSGADTIMVADVNATAANTYLEAVVLVGVAPTASSVISQTTSVFGGGSSGVNVLLA
jgi:hypothetical protein